MSLNRPALFLTAASLLMAAPATGAPWSRPDCRPVLFDAAALSLDDAGRAALVNDLLLVVRNLPDSSAVTPLLRSQALGVVLRLDAANAAAHIANGQLARGLRPEPLPVEATATADGIAARLIKTARLLLDARENAAHGLAYLLFDLAVRLDPLQASAVSFFTYGTTMAWPPPLPPEPSLWAAPELLIKSGTIRIITGLTEGKPRTFTVSAQAGPGKPGQKLQAVLPEELLSHMWEKKQQPLREEIERRSLHMRDFLHLRHDDWPEGWRVQFSFSEDARQLLPQAFAGMTAVLDSMLYAQPLDPRVLIAGGVDAAGNFTCPLPADDVVLAVAQTEPGAVLILPRAAMGELEDWLLARPAQWTQLTKITIMSTSQTAGMLAALREEKEGKFAESFALFEEIAAPLREAADPLSLLRQPENIAKLQNIAALHPQHVNAGILLRIATQTMPRHLSLRGSLRQMQETAAPLLSRDRNRYPLNVKPKPFEKSVFSRAGAELNSMRPRLHPRSMPYLDDLLAIANVLHQASGGGREPSVLPALRSRAEKNRKALWEQNP